MASLTQLPWEILFEIKSFCTDNDLGSLCFACKTFTEWLQPTVYAKVSLTAKPSCGRRLQAIGSGPRAKFVRRIEYEPRYWHPVAPEEDGVDWKPLPLDDEDRPVDTESPLAVDTSFALMSLHLQFPNLESFSFAPVYYPRVKSEGQEDGYADDYAEHMVPSIARLNASLWALCQSAGAFTRLEVHQLPLWPYTTGPPYPTLSSANPAWTELVAGLTSLDVELHDPVEDFCYEFDIEPCLYLSTLCSYFISCIPNVQHLRLTGRQWRHLLAEEVAIPWMRLEMPCLKTLHLEWTPIDEGFCMFIANHLVNLEEVRLPNCVSRCIETWSLLATCILELCPPWLATFEITPALPEYFFHGDERVQKDDMPDDHEYQQFYATSIWTEVGWQLIEGEDSFDEDGFTIWMWSKVQALIEENREARLSEF